MPPITIPDLNLVGSGPSLPRADASAAMAPGMALRSVAEGVTDVAAQLEAHNARILEVENARAITEIKTKARTAYANFQASLTEDHDYRTYQEKWESTMGQLRAEIDKGEYSGLVRDQASIFLEDFAGDTRIGVAAAMQRKAVERGKLAFSNAFQSTVDGYNPMAGPPSMAPVEELLADQAWMLPEEKDMYRQKFQDAASAKARIAEIHADPEDWMERHQDAGDMDISQWYAMRQTAKELIGQRAVEAAMEAQDMIALGQLTNPDDVDDVFANLRPSARERIKEQIIKRNSAIEQAGVEAKRNNPEYQQELVGTLIERIKGYDPDLNDFDAELVDIQMMIGEVREAPIREELEAQLARIRGTEETEIRTAQDLVLDQLDDAFDAKKIGIFTAGQSVDSAIAAGLLEDRAKLEAAGFSPEQVEELTAVGLAGTKRKALFQRLWPRRPGNSAALPPYEQAAFEAIASGKEKFETIDEAALAKARQAHGRARIELKRVMQAYPDDPAKWEEMAKSLGVEVEADTILNDELEEWNTPGGLGGEEWDTGGVLPPLQD